jgi:hypothetical protein
MWRQASLPAVEGGILPPGKKLRLAKRSELTGISFVVTPVRRAGSHGSTSAKMADATFFRPALRLVGLAFLFCLLFNPCSVKSLEPTTSSPDKIKAAFLRNFAHYVTWPTNAGPGSSWQIGVLGNDPFGDVLEKTFAGRMEQGRPFEIHRAATLAALPPCQIIYIAEQDARKRRAILAALKDQPVLTVGDASEFLQEGGIIRFQIRSRVEISVNLDQARAVSLKIPSQMLEVSREVLENKTLRKLR